MKILEDNPTLSQKLPNLLVTIGVKVLRGNINPRMLRDEADKQAADR